MHGVLFIDWMKIVITCQIEISYNLFIDFLPLIWHKKCSVNTPLRIKVWNK